MQKAVLFIFESHEYL